METENKRANSWRRVALISMLVALIAICALVITNMGRPDNPGAKPPAAPKDILASWNDCESRNAFTSYIEAITKKDSPDFIPVEDRIAVFDLDGTLFCETDPGYFDHMLYYHRVTEDPNYKDKATEEEKRVAGVCKEYFDTRKYPAGLDIDHGKGVATSFAGMTLDEFYAYVKEFREQPANGYTGMKKGEAFYKPMLEIIQCLQANEFTVYVVSGTDRFIVRGLLKDSDLNLPANQIIGSDSSLVATGQNGKDGLEYVLTDSDKVVMGGEFFIKNLKMNKVTAIMQEIGKQPVLSFGNSSGDSSMAKYVTKDNKYKSMAFMLCCDDLVRENGNTEAAEKMVKMCSENGWNAISMKNDWKTIYKEGVTRKS